MNYWLELKMDSKDEARLLRLYDEVSSGESYVSSESSDKAEIEPDPFEDDGAYGNDPNYNPESQDYDSTSSSETENLVNPREIIDGENNIRGNQKHFGIFLLFHIDFFLGNDDTQEWYEDLADIKNFQFDDSCSGIKVLITNTMTPADVFKLLWTDEITNLVLNNSNEYGHNMSVSTRPHRKNNRTTKFNPIDHEELEKFIGITLLRAQIGFPVLRWAFSSDPLFFHPVFRATMSGRRYEQILRYLCCSKMQKQSIDRLHKIAPLLTLLLHNFQNVRKPNEILSLDESLLLFRGRLSFRQYIKGKKAKYGIKFFELCSSDGYVYNIEIYKGKQDIIETASKIDSLVLRLMAPYLNQGHHLIMDNYYNSVTLSQLLLNTYKTHTTGTLRANRKRNPKVVTTYKLKKGQHVWRRSGGIYVSKWRDNRDVLMITTKYHPQMIQITNSHGQVITHVYHGYSPF